MRMYAWSAASFVLLAHIAPTALGQSPGLNISGRWQGSFDITAPNGTIQHDTAFFILSQSGSRLSGSAGRTEDMQTTVTDGSIRQQQVHFMVVVRPGTSVIFNLHLNGDHLQGQATGLVPDAGTRIDVDTVRVKTDQASKVSGISISSSSEAVPAPSARAEPKAPLFSQTSSSLDTSISAKMEDIIRSGVAAGSFMGAILVAKGNKVILNHGYGSADLEWNIPNSPTTKFRIGSITKQFTAASILMLEERGRLKLSDPLTKYIPEAPVSWKHITIFHLLTHTSGIVSITNLPPEVLALWKPATSLEVISRFRDKPLEFEPGSQAKYSNSGYILLGYIIEKVSGESYAKFLQQNIIEPLGMRDSGVDSNSAILPQRAQGYRVGGNGLEHAEYIDMTVPLGAGDMYTTTEDLQRWELALFGGKVLSQESFKKMTTPYKDNFGLGVVITSENGRKLISHTGGIQGFVGDLRYYPGDQVLVVVLGNSENKRALEIAQRLSRVELEN